MNIPWEIIIPAVIELIAGCLDNTNDAEIRAAFKTPTPAQRALVQWAVMRHIRPRDRMGRRKEIMDEFWARAESASASEVDAIMNQAYQLAA